MTAGAGDDTLVGGAGSDTYVFGSSATGSDTIDDTQDTNPNDTGNILDFRQLAPDASNNGIALELATTGTSQTVLPGVLSLNLSSNDLAGLVLGTRGNDSVTGGGGDASTVFIGGPGDDTLTGTGNDNFAFVDLDGVAGWDIGTNEVNGHVLQGGDTINEAVLVTDPNAPGNTVFFGAPADVKSQLTWLTAYPAPLDRFGFAQRSGWPAPGGERRRQLPELSDPHDQRSGQLQFRGGQ